MMIFYKFIAGSKLDEADEREQQVALEAASSGVALASDPLEGAIGCTVNKLKRLMQVSSSKLVGRQQRNAQEQSIIKEKLDVSEAQDDEEQIADVQLEQQQQQQQQPAKKAAANWQLERKYTLKEVQQHCSLDDCWMVIFDKVYDITEFVFEHPGGDFILLEYAGRDATHPFLSSRHGSSAYKMLDKYWIGILVDEELYYSNHSSYCSVYSNLSWRSTPTLDQVSSGGSSSSGESDTSSNAADSATLKVPAEAQSDEPTSETEHEQTSATSTSRAPSDSQSSNDHLRDSSKQESQQPQTAHESPMTPSMVVPTKSHQTISKQLNDKHNDEDDEYHLYGPPFADDDDHEQEDMNSDSANTRPEVPAKHLSDECRTCLTPARNQPARSSSRGSGGGTSPRSRRSRSSGGNGARR